MAPWRAQPAEPACFWIARFQDAGRRGAGAGPARWLVDLPSGSLRRDRPGLEEAGGRRGEPTGTVVWVPPVSAAERPRRDAHVERLANLDNALVVSLFEDDPGPAATIAWRGVAVWDLAERAIGAPRGAAAAAGDLPGAARPWAQVQRFGVWPLIAGLSDDPERFDAMAAEAAAAGWDGLRPWAAELTAESRRALAIGLRDATGEPGAEAAGGSDWHHSFHAAPPDDRPFLALAARRGLKPFPARPSTGAREAAPSRRANRRAAERLFLAAEWWQRAGRPEATAAALRAAARRIEDLDLDLEALRREGNLRLLPDLHPVAAAIAGSEATPLEAELAAIALGAERGGAGS